MSEEFAEAIKDCFDRKNVGTFNHPKWEQGEALAALEEIGSAIRAGSSSEECGEPDIAWHIKRIADALERIANKIAP